MQRHTTTQNAAVALAVGTLILSLADFLCRWHLSRLGLTAQADRVVMAAFVSGSPLAWGDGQLIEAVSCRLCYPFLHAHPLHAAVNGWVLLQVAFRTRLSFRHLWLAFLVAWSCPAVVAEWPEVSHAVVGLSGVVYALLGMWMPRVSLRLRYNAVILLGLAAGVLTGSVAVGLHLYCYLLGATMTHLLDNPSKI